MTSVSQALRDAARVLSATVSLDSLLPKKRETYGKAVQIPLSSLVTLATRDGIQEGRIAKVHDARLSGKSLSPIEVDVYPSGVLSIGDGNHRLEEARRAGLDHVKVRLRRLGEAEEWDLYNEARERRIIPQMPISEEVAQRATARVADLNTDLHKGEIAWNKIQYSAPGDDLRGPVRDLSRSKGVKVSKAIKALISKAVSAKRIALTPAQKRQALDAWGSPGLGDAPHIAIKTSRSVIDIRIRKMRSGHIRIDEAFYDPGR